MKYDNFRALHERPGIFVIPNPWNGGSARILTSLGFEALATTSAGYAFSVGMDDSSALLSRDGLLANAKEIVDATHLPVSADLQNGFGPTPKACAEMVRLAVGVGLAGGSIEDESNDPKYPIFEFGLAVERVAAAAVAARHNGFFLTARCENFLHDAPDLDDTIARLKAYAEAGADCLYAPGLPSLEAIRQVCSAVAPKPVNALMGLRGATYTVGELEKVGVKRISVGAALARVAFGAFVKAAKEIKERGTFTFAADAISHADMKTYMGAKRSDRTSRT